MAKRPNTALIRKLVDNRATIDRLTSSLGREDPTIADALRLMSRGQSDLVQAFKLLTKQGDILSHDGTQARVLPVGKRGNVLMPDIREQTGLIWRELPLCVLGHSEAPGQTISNNSLTPLAFDTTDHDTTGGKMHDEVTNNSRIIIPEDGFYMVAYE
jgi:hypothetical protein